MEPFKKKTSPYYYVRIYTPQEKLGYYEKSTKTKLKREAEAIQKKWQDEADLVKNCSSDSSKEISLILQNLLNYSSSGRLSLDEWDEGADKIDRLINPDPLAHFTLSMWYNHWLNNNDDIAPSTRAVYRATGEELKLHPQSKIKLNRLSSIDCRKLQKAVKDGGKGSRSGNTTNLIVSPLRASLQDAVYDGVLRKNPFVDVKREPIDTKEKGFFFVEEIEKILLHADHGWRGMIYIAVHTTLRLTNCALIKWDEVHFNRSQIILYPVKQRHKFKKLTPNGKGKLKKLPIYGNLDFFLKTKAEGLTQGLSEFEGIELYSKEWCELFHKHFGNQYVLPNCADMREKGESWLSESFNRLMIKAGIPKTQTLEDGTVARRSFHCFKHTTNWLMMKGDISEEIRHDICGHTTKAVHNHYKHEDPERIKKALEKSVPNFVVSA